MIEVLSPAPGAVFAGNYRILKPLGEQDGVASFLAEQAGAAAPRTLKILAPQLAQDPALRARFESDLRIGARVASPNVARSADPRSDRPRWAPLPARREATATHRKATARRLCRRGAPPRRSPRATRCRGSSRSSA